MDFFSFRVKFYFLFLCNFSINPRHLFSSFPLIFFFSSTSELSIYIIHSLLIVHFWLIFVLYFFFLSMERTMKSRIFAERRNFSFYFSRFWFYSLYVHFFLLYAIKILSLQGLNAERFIAMELKEHQFLRLLIWQSLEFKSIRSIFFLRSTIQ